MGYISPKSLDMGPILVKKSLEEGPISQNLRKIVKSAFLRQKNSLEMGLDCENFEENVYSAIFWVRKILRYAWLGVSNLGPYTPSKNNSSTPPVLSTEIVVGTCTWLYQYS